MSDPQHETHDDVDAGPNHGSTSGTPRWVKIFGAVAAVIIALLIVLAVAGGGGDHGPGRHGGDHESSEGVHE